MSEPIEALLNKVSADIAALPSSAAQLVGALVALHSCLPPWLTNFLMTELARRADMSKVSPAAEAVMRMGAFAAYTDMEFAQEEIRVQHALLKAVALDDKLLVAAAFLQRMAVLFERFAAIAPDVSVVSQTPEPSARRATQSAVS